MLITDNSYY